MIHESRRSVEQVAQVTALTLPSIAWPVANHLTLYHRLGKRWFDATAAAFGLLVTSPLLVICAVAVWLDSPGPIFFRQHRIGKRRKPFEIVKFRTMVHRERGSGPKITAEGDTRITTVGKWLRKTKLDELPQLFNVLKGEMSLVGPRPEVPEYVAFYDADQMRVLAFKPGVTGPASLAYIDEEKLLAAAPDKEAFYLNVLMPRKIGLDLWYCERASLVEDLRLIFATLAKLFSATSWPASIPASPPMAPAFELSKPQRLSDISLDNQQGVLSSHRPRRNY
ncbi:MAG: sugar transferase [Acidobacteriia bacterium]|nr:sugar transferase [Terriglobia bacterium]